MAAICLSSLEIVACQTCCPTTCWTFALVNTSVKDKLPSSWNNSLLLPELDLIGDPFTRTGAAALPDLRSKVVMTDCDKRSGALLTTANFVLSEEKEIQKATPFLASSKNSFG